MIGHPHTYLLCNWCVVMWLSNCDWTAVIGHLMFRDQFMFNGMNELPVIRYLNSVQRVLGLPGGKHCKLLEGNIQCKVVFAAWGL